MARPTRSKPRGGSPLRCTAARPHLCSGALLLFGIPRVVVGENETFMGAEDLLRAHGVDVVVRRSQECVDLMNEFITTHPDIWYEDIGEHHDRTAE
jgi:cytosine deaminase